MPDGSNPRTDLGVSLFVIVLCAAVLWEARGLPPGTFEPLGSAPIPRATAWVIILLCLIVMGRAVMVLRRGAVAAAADPGYGARPLDAAVTLGLTVHYVLAMAFRLTGFAILTSVFLFVTIAFLARFERRLLPVAAVVALIMGFGCEYVFTRVFVVDLPAG
jgi:hypothetical protein